MVHYCASIGEKAVEWCITVLPLVRKQLKELEKLGPKKGVITQSVKDVVQTLVDDDLVSKDKIGTSVYFWSLPSCAGNQLRNVYRKLEADLQSSEKRFAELVEQREALKKGREDSVGITDDFDYLELPAIVPQQSAGDLTLEGNP
ncbi:Meiotic nuclear division protein 1 [Sarracenia purpurea var. burkii]